MGKIWVETEVLEIDLAGRIFALARLTILFLVIVSLRSSVLVVLGSLLLTEQTLVTHVGKKPSVIHSMLAQVSLSVVLCRAAEGKEQMKRGGLRRVHLRGFHYRDTQHVLRITGERDLVGL